MLYIILILSLSIISNILLSLIIFIKIRNIRKLKKCLKEKDLYYLRRENQHFFIYQNMVKRWWPDFIKKRKQKK